MLYDAVVCLTYILAIYGLLMLVSGIAESIRCRVRGRRPRVRVILLVRDSEEHIEYIVRSAVRKELPARLLSDAKLTIMDAGSADNTYELLERLREMYPCIEVCRISDMERILTDMAPVRR